MFKTINIKQGLLSFVKLQQSDVFTLKYDANSSLMDSNSIYIGYIRDITTKRIYFFYKKEGMSGILLLHSLLILTDWLLV